MKKTRISPTPAAILLCAALASLSSSHAATVYWDTNGDTPGSGTTADGTWDVGTTANWSTDSTGSASTTTFTNADDVVFSAGTDVLSASITVSGAPAAQSVTFEEGAYTLSGNFGLSSSLTVATGASASSSGIITANNNLSFAIEGSFTGNLNGTGKTITKTGAGTLTLTDANSNDYSINANGGLVILQRSTTKQLKISSIGNGGTMRLASSEQLGNSLAVNTGGTLELNAGVTETVGNLTGGGAIVGGNNTSLGMTGGTFSGTISGDLDLVKSGSGTHTFSGASTSSGNITVSAGTLTLASTGSLTFFIGTDGVNNAISGAGAATFDGTFVFDLSGATLLDGNSWLIADVATQSFSGTFAVNGFTDDDLDNVWTNGSGLSFSEASGILSYSAIPEPSSFALVGGLASLAAFGLRRRRRAA